MRQANPKLAAKLFPRQPREKIDTVRDNTPFRRNNDVLMDAFLAWSGLEEFRKMCERNEQYTFGDQWGDRVQDPDSCKMVTERQHILNQGNIPLQNNRIRGIIRTVSGVFQSAQTEPVCVARDRDEQSKGEIMSTAIQYVYQLNKLWGLDTAAFTSFLVTGLGTFKSIYGWRNDKMDVWNDYVNHRRVFFDNHMEDPRHWDCHLVGEVHDLGLYDVISKFAGGSQVKAREIRQLYAHSDTQRTISNIQNLINRTYERKFDNFFMANDETRCRVIEVWKKESKERLRVHDRLTGEYYKAEIEDEQNLIAENARRVTQQTAQGLAPEDMKLIEIEWFVDNYWYYYFMTPYGDILQEGETPFWHGSHPYSFKIYPFFNGKVHPFVGDFIDQQRYINRLITLQDFVIRASAKGVLLVPEESIPDGMKLEDYADVWAKYNGVIPFKAKPGVPLPQQIIASAVQPGVTDLLSIQLKLLEDISGVQGALQGRTASSGTPAALYMQQSQNSATALTELFEAFKELREERDTKNMKLIQQFYTEPKYINITGNNARRGSIMYNPSTVRNAEFDLSITESTGTPAYRMVMNDFLMQLFSAQQISLEELLQNGAFPFADKLLQSIEARKKAAMDTQGPAGSMVPPDIQQELSDKTNPLVSQMLAGNNPM
jgi:hypothetical protein